MTESQSINVVNEGILAYKSIVTNKKKKPKLKNLYKLLGITPNKMQEELIRLWDKEYKNYYGFGLYCGRGTGKSVAASTVITLDLLIPGSSVILVSPSNAQLKIIWDQVVKNLKRLNIPIAKIDNNTKEMLLENGSEFAAFSEKSVENAEGRRCSVLCVDEGGLIQRLDQIMQSLTPALGRYGTYDNGMQIGKILFVGTPKQNNIAYYQYYLKGKQKGTGWISLSFPSSINPLNTPEFLENQRNILDEKTYLQEYEAQWVFIKDQLVFKDFDIDKNIKNMSDLKRMIDKDSDLIFGLDIGATDSTSFIMVYHEGGKYYVFDGFSINNSSERTIAEHIQQKLKQYNIELSEQAFIDPSAKLTRIGLATDYNLNFYPAMNAVRESVTLLNDLFRQEKLFVDKEMLELIDQIQKLEWKENTNSQTDPFKRVKGHHFDMIAAMRYAIYTHNRMISNQEIIVI